MSASGPEFDLLATIESGSADRRILEFAARGFVPLAPPDLARAVATILAGQDAELVALAEETFKTFDQETLVAAVSSPGALESQLAAVARHSTDPKVLEPLIRARRVSDETLAWLAERVSSDLQDIIITNQARLLASPVILERLFENPQLSADIRRRADEFLEEFFLKKEREAEEEEKRLAEERAAAAALAAKTGAAAAAGEAEAAEEAPAEEEGEESLFARVATMSVAQRIRLAYKGNREERLFLIRDNNRLVSTAVLKSPKTREGDAEAIATMKSVSEDVLRYIGLRRDWMRSPAIMSALVKNPRSPIDITMPLVNRLSARDQKLLAIDRNVPEAVRASARRAVARRES